MKSFVILFLIFLLFPIVSAALEVEVIEKENVVISEFNNPAVYELVIYNNGEGDTFEIYSLVGVSMSPKGTFWISPGGKRLEVKAYLNEEMRKRKGAMGFEYQLRGVNTGIYKGTLQVKVVPLQDVLRIKGDNINLGDEKVFVTITNTQNTAFEDIKFDFNSDFFEHSEKLSFKPFEVKNLTIGVDKDISRLSAGIYYINADILVDKVSAEIKGLVNYLEKGEVGTSEEKSGLIIRKNTITKLNDGNTPQDVEISLDKNVVTRLFSVYSEEPQISERNGLLVSYTWKKDLGPGESYDITTTTNYTFPFILIFLIVFVTFLVKIYSATGAKISKKITFVKTKHGEFALRVTLSIRARRFSENVKVIDGLPAMTKLYEGFGRQPDKVDANTRKMVWNLGNLSSGEEKVFSYIIYSKVQTIGRFELPAAVVSYEVDGRIQRGYSNRVFFVNDTGEE